MPQDSINQALWLEEVGSEEVADIQTHPIHPACFQSMVLIYYNICVGITYLFVLLTVFEMFFVLTIVWGLTIILASLVSSLKYEKDCVGCLFNSLLWVWSCHAACALPRSITKVKQPVYFGASPSNWEIKCFNENERTKKCIHGTICSCGTDAFEVSIFLRAGVWVYIFKKKN